MQSIQFNDDHVVNEIVQEEGAGAEIHNTRRKKKSARAAREDPSYSPPPPQSHILLPSSSGPKKLSIISSSIRKSSQTPRTTSSKNGYINVNAKPKTTPSFPATDSYIATTTHFGHPRDLVPAEVGFPPVELRSLIRDVDLADRLLMATCAVLHSHGNRALCPKEVAEVMFERGWLHNA